MSKAGRHPKSSRLRGVFSTLLSCPTIPLTVAFATSLACRIWFKVGLRAATLATDNDDAMSADSTLQTPQNRPQSKQSLRAPVQNHARYQTR